MIDVELLDTGDLSPRQAEVLARICQGKPDKVIARELAISIKTVEANCAEIYARMHTRQATINARCATIAQAVARGMVRLSSTALVWLLMVSSVDIDDQALRSSRIRAARGVRVVSVRMAGKGLV